MHEAPQGNNPEESRKDWTKATLLCSGGLRDKGKQPGRKSGPYSTTLAVMAFRSSSIRALFRVLSSVL